MLTVSLHGISISAAKGLYAEEHTINNLFHVDVDVYVPAMDTKQLPFVDYTIIRAVVADAFEQPYDLLEQFIHHIYVQLKHQCPAAEKIKVAIKKMHPPMTGEVSCAMVVFEG